jgi:hypothetical protein
MPIDSSRDKVRAPAAIRMKTMMDRLATGKERREVQWRLGSNAIRDGRNRFRSGSLPNHENPVDFPSPPELVRDCPVAMLPAGSRRQPSCCNAQQERACDHER